MLKEGIYLYSVCRRGHCDQAEVFHKGLCCVSCKINNTCEDYCNTAIKELPETQETGKKSFCEYAVKVFKKKDQFAGGVQEKLTNSNPNSSCQKSHCDKHKSLYCSRCCWFCREVHSCGRVCQSAKPGRKCEYISDRMI